MNKIIDKKYKVLEELGHGASSTVYLVEDADNNQFALKLLNRKIREKKIQRLKNEFRLMRSLKHPNIARVYDFGFDEELDFFYFTLEYLSEGNFYHFNNQFDDEAILLKSFYQLLCGLSYLHANNFIHFDVTPNNVLVTKDENGEFVVKITDFGFTEQFESADFRFAGTLNFMSPEMIQGRKGLDQRTDLFSAGLILLYYLIDSDRYLPASSVEEYIKIRQEFDSRIIREKINRITDFRFQMLLSRLLEVDPAARLNSADEAISVLNHSFSIDFALPVQNEISHNFSDFKLFRKDELDKIITLFSATRICKNYFVVVSGEKGSGKGRILEEFKLHNQFNNTRVYHISFPEHIVEPFSGLRSLVKNMLYFYYDNRPDDFNELYELVFDNQIDLYSQAEKEAFFQRVIVLSKSFFDKRKVVIVIDNLESADNETLLFINYFIKHAYQQTHMFLLFFINQRLIKDNFEEYRQLFAYTGSIVRMTLAELEIGQIKEIVNCFFKNIRDIPENLYKEMQILTGTNISRLIKFLKYLHDENVIVKSLKGYAFSHYIDFSEVIKNFVRQEINYDENALSQDQQVVLHTLAISLTDLTIEELSKISGLLPLKTEEIINQLFDRFFIRHLSAEQSSYLIYETAIKRLISVTISLQNRKAIHRKIAMSITPSRNEKYRNKRVFRVLHFLLGTEYNKFVLPDFKLQVLKKILFSEQNYDVYFNFCNLLILENENLSLANRVFLLSEIAVGSIEKKCKYDYTECTNNFLIECNANPELLKNYDLNFKYLIVGLLVNKKELTEKTPEDFLNGLCLYLEGCYETKIRAMNVFLLAYERFFNSSGKMPCIDNLLQAMKSDKSLDAEYYFVRIIAIFFTKSTPDQADLNFTDEFFQEISNFFIRVKSGNNPDLVARTYLIISGFYKKCTYDNIIMDFFHEAENYFSKRQQSEALFSLKSDFVTFLQRNNCFVLALSEINSALLQVVKYQDLEKLSGLIKKRVNLKYILEENVGIVATDYNLLLDFLHKQKSETAEIYEGLINLYLEAGNYKEVFETLHRYLKSMNREMNLSKRSKEFYLLKLLQYYNISQLRNLSSTLLLDLHWSDDEFLEHIIDLKTQSKIYDNDPIISWKSTLSNHLICDILDEYHKTEKSEKCDLFLQISEKYDHDSCLYKRAKLVYKILDGSYKNETIEILKTDLNALYGKGYCNTARNLTSEIAKILFFIYRDEKNFLLMAELAFKISGDLYYSTDAEFRSLVKDENFLLINDLVKDIKKRYKK